MFRKIFESATELFQKAVDAENSGNNNEAAKLYTQAHQQYIEDGDDISAAMSYICASDIDEDVAAG
jgi:hypothetical protein